MRAHRYLLSAVLLLGVSRVAVAEDVKVSEVTYGSTIKLEHVATKHRLHSHKVTYGSGSGQQSVTGFSDNGDANSYWIVRSAHGKAAAVAGKIVKCGETIRVQHLNTGRNLHSHEHRAPMNRDYEVSCYGGLVGRWAEGDMGDNWTVMCGSGSWKRGEDVRFYHDETKAYLAASGKLKFGDPIPDQLQVSGSSWKNGNTIWRTNEGFYLAPPTSK